MLAILCSLLLLQSASPTPPADDSRSRGRRGGGRTAVDLATARQRLFEKVPPDERDFEQLVVSAFQEMQNRELPSSYEDPDVHYGAEHLAFRAEVYGPLLADPRL